jgi:hypothetical protein
MSEDGFLPRDDNYDSFLRYRGSVTDPLCRRYTDEEYAERIRKFEAYAGCLLENTLDWMQRYPEVFNEVTSRHSTRIWLVEVAKRVQERGWLDSVKNA